MSKTAKAVMFVVALCATIGIVSTSLTQASPPGGNPPGGFCNNLVNCIIADPFVQAAIEFATHQRYTDAEAVTAMGFVEDENPLNHDRYTDDEARVAVGFPVPDYDSGFVEVIGNPMTLTHNLGGNHEEYIVHMMLQDNLPVGINNRGIGGFDGFFRGTWYSYTDAEEILVHTGELGGARFVRVRIWRMD